VKKKSLLTVTDVTEIIPDINRMSYQSKHRFLCSGAPVLNFGPGTGDRDIVFTVFLSSFKKIRGCIRQRISIHIHSNSYLLNIQSFDAMYSAIFTPPLNKHTTYNKQDVLGIINSLTSFDSTPTA
jgi:hypothetical protein